MTDEKGMVLYERAAVTTIPDATNLRAIATDLLNSGLYPQIKSATQAIAVIATGQELGLGPTASLQYISIVNGKMCAEAKVWLALFHRSGGKTKVLKRDKEGCKIEFSKPGREPYVHEYTAAMADAEGLTGKGGAWTKMKETMLQWRCVSGGIRVYDPGVTMGISLTTEEAEDYPLGITAEVVKEEPTKGEAKKEPEKAPEAQKPAQEAKPAPKASPAPEKGKEPGKSPKNGQKPAAPKPQPPAGGAFGEESQPGDDIAGMAESAEKDAEEEALVAKIKAGLEAQGVDVKSFKEWLLGHQPKMRPAVEGGPRRKFVVQWKNAIRFHGGVKEDLEYLLTGLEPAIAMFRYATRPNQDEEKD